MDSKFTAAGRWMECNKTRIALALAATAFIGGQLAQADELETLYTEQAFEDLGHQLLPSSNVRQAAYENLTLSPATGQAVPESHYSPMQQRTSVVPAANGPQMPMPPTEVWGGPPVVCHPPDIDWIVGLEMLRMESHLTSAKFGPWTADPGNGGRLVLAMETPIGLSTRARFWGLAFDDAPPAEEVDITVGAFDMDFYQRIRFNQGELRFGAGATNRKLQFELGNGDASEFTGEGGSVFVEGYTSLVHFERSEIGFVGRGRWTILDGEWKDDTLMVIPPTDHDSMTVMEIAWGVEYRHRFGNRRNHAWIVGILAEYQRWDSSWMGEFIGSSPAFTGANLNFSVIW